MVNFKPHMLAVQLHSVDFHFSKDVSYLGYGFFFFFFLTVWNPSSITWAWHHWHPMQVMVPSLQDVMSDIWAMSHIKSPGRKELPLQSCQQVHLNFHGPNTPHGPHCLELFHTSQSPVWIKLHGFLSLWVKVQDYPAAVAKDEHTPVFFFLV